MAKMSHFTFRDCRERGHRWNRLWPEKIGDRRGLSSCSWQQVGTWQGLLRAAGLKLGQHQNPLSPWSFCFTRSGDGLRICISNQSLETTLWAPTALKGTKSGSARFVEERAEVPFGGVAGKVSSEGSLERTATKWKSLSPVREGD